MTTLKDLIRDIVVEYIKDKNEGFPEDSELLTTEISEVIKEFMNRNLN